MGKFKLSEAEIRGVYVLEPTVFGDSRGYFAEVYNKKEFSALGLNMNFVQDNESKSKNGVLRGLHFQTKIPQGKLMRVITGEIFDVAVDLRRDSPSFAKWFGINLSEHNKKMLYIPEGFAHGFLVLSDTAVINYKCTTFYSPENESGIIWNDPTLGIKWPLERVKEIHLSEKDSKLGKLV